VLETELKLEVSAENLDILKRHPLFRNLRSSGKHELVSIYLDTKDRTFGRQGFRSGYGARESSSSGLSRGRIMEFSTVLSGKRHLISMEAASPGRSTRF
jgi:hypothetical protein